MIRIGVAGACGRMGQAIVTAISEASNVTLGGVWERPDSTRVGETYGTTSLLLQPGPNALAEDIDVAIDFTAPLATIELAQWAALKGVPLVVGTTGLEAEHHAVLDKAAQKVPILQAPNMSVGVNALFGLAAKAARMLGDSWDLEIVETHHRRKKDAPSGTAMGILEALQTVRTDADGVYARHGMIGARTDSEIGVQTLRGGDVVGEHTVFYFGEGERIELTHRATDRAIFARGAVRAAHWLTSQSPGRYSMADVLGLND